VNLVIGKQKQRKRQRRKWAKKEASWDEVAEDEVADAGAQVTGKYNGAAS